MLKEAQSYPNFLYWCIHVRGVHIAFFSGEAVLEASLREGNVCTLALVLESWYELSPTVIGSRRYVKPHIFFWPLNPNNLSETGNDWGLEWSAFLALPWVWRISKAENGGRGTISLTQKGCLLLQSTSTCFWVVKVICHLNEVCAFQSIQQIVHEHLSSYLWNIRVSAEYCLHNTWQQIGSSSSQFKESFPTRPGSSDQTCYALMPSSPLFG